MAKRRVADEGGGNAASAADRQDGDATPFDVARVRELVEIMHAHELSEMDLRWAGARIFLRRGGVAQTVTPSTLMPPPAAPAAPIAAPAASAAPAAPPQDAGVTINSPIVDT